MSHEYTTSKHELRASLRAKLADLSADAKAVASASIASQVLALDLYQRASVVMVYAAMPDEPDLAVVAQHALATGKTLLVPRVHVTGVMTAGVVRHWPGDLEQTGGYSSSRSDAPIVEPASIHLVVVPGVAFDRDGHRLGRGKGHYDRFLAAVPTPRRLGVAFACQLVPRVPADAHDLPVARVLHE